MNTDFVPYIDIDAYHAWRDRRVTPAYLRGLPGWTWQTAMKRGRHRPHAAGVT